MSALPNQTNINLREQFFVLVNASTITANSFIGDRGIFSTITFQNIDISGIDLSGGFITAEKATISSIYTRALYLDDNLLQTYNSTLFYNGTALASFPQTVSSITNWALYPQVADLNSSNYNIKNTNNIATKTLNASISATIKNLNTSNITNGGDITTNTLEAVGETTFGSLMTANNGIIIANGGLSVESNQPTNLTGALLVNGNATFTKDLTVNGVITTTSSIVVSDKATFSGVVNVGSNLTVGGTLYSAGTATFNQGAVVANLGLSMSGQDIAGANNIASQSLNTTNNAQVGYLTTNTIVAPITTSFGIDSSYLNQSAIDNVNITANRGIDVADYATVNLTAKNGKAGQVNLQADGGYALAGLGSFVGGSIQLTANAGFAEDISYGGTIALVANSGFGTLSNLTSKITLNSAGILSWAGAGIPIGSVLGYNYLHGDVAVSITSGSLTAGGTVAGTTTIRSANGTVNFGGFYSDTIAPNSNGDLSIEGYTYSGTRRGVRISDVNALSMNTGTTIYADNIQTNGITFPSYVYNQITTGITNVHILTFVPQIYDGGLATSITDIQLIHFVASQNSAIDGIKFITFTGGSAISGLSSITVAQATVSSITGLTTLDNLSTITAQNLNVSSINNVAYPPIYNLTSTFTNVYASNVYTNTLNTSSILTSTINLGAGGSINNLSNLALTGTLTAPSISNVNTLTFNYPGTLSNLYNLTLLNELISPIVIVNSELVMNGNIIGLSNLIMNGTLNVPNILNSTIYTSSITTTFASASNLAVASNITSPLITTPAIATTGNLSINNLSGTLTLTNANLTNTTSSNINFSATTGTYSATSYNSAYLTSVNGNIALTSYLPTRIIAPSTINSGDMYSATYNGYTISQLINQPQISSFSTLTVSSINGLAYPPPSQNAISSFQTLATSSFTVSSINGAIYPPPNTQVVSTFQNLATSSFTVSSINGFAYNPNPPLVSSFNTLYASSFNANTISTGLINAGLINANTISTGLINGSVFPQPATSNFTNLTTRNLFVDNITQNTTTTVNINASCNVYVSTSVGFVGFTTPEVIFNTPLIQANTSNMYLTGNLEAVSYSGTTATLGTIKATALNASTLAVSSITNNTLFVNSILLKDATPGNYLQINSEGDDTYLYGKSMDIYASAEMAISADTDIQMVGSNGITFKTTTSLINFQTPEMIFNTPLIQANTSNMYLTGNLEAISYSGNTATLGTVNATTLSTLALNVSSVNGLSYPQPAPITSTFSNIYTYAVNNNPAFSSNLGVNATGSLVLNGASINAYSSSNILLQTGAYNALSVNSPSTILAGDINAQTFNGYNVSQFLNSNTAITSTFTNLYTSTLNVSSIDGYNISQLINQPTVSSFTNLNTSTLVVSSINGQVFPQVIPPAVITSTFSNLYTTTLGNNPVSPNININTVSTILSGDINAQTFNGYNVSAFLNSNTPITSTFNTLYTSTISGNPLNYLSLVANRSITLQSLSSINNVRGAWYSGDITASTFNGQPLPTGGGSSVITSTFTNLYTSYIYNNPATGAFAYQMNVINQSVDGEINITATNGTVARLNMEGLYVNTIADTAYQLTAPVITLTGYSNITLTTPSTITTGDLNVITINGQSYPPPSSWTSLATSDLNMNGYNITSPTNLNITGSNLSLTNITTLTGVGSTSNNIYFDGSNNINFNCLSALVLGGCNVVLNSALGLQIGEKSLYQDGSNYFNFDGSNNFNLYATGVVNLNGTSLTFNGTPVGGGGGGWVGTATSDLNMAGYVVKNAPTYNLSNSGNQGTLSLDSNAQLNYTAQPSGYSGAISAPIPLTQGGTARVVVSDTTDPFDVSVLLDYAYQDTTYFVVATSSEATTNVYYPGVLSYAVEISGSNSFNIICRATTTGTYNFNWITTGKYPIGSAV